ncbi:TetR/AcrR family transcriptional regulator [Ktedonosporobacter rubrisoli]|uniref:TetR/AcrR family transcriptional regulator n=1 Tax=Ktedonosporobacter rubrisoli TaxID=2509675 RepID=UPI001F5DD33A|nr:TetR/AcrR family transcriptional regulator [Ktedonosporobacter rubrisoli]
MSQNSNDLRAKRTRKLLREALLELIEERGFDAITVGELASRAMVSRAAFYRYYQDKYDLVEQIFKEAMQTFIRDIGPHPYASLSLDLQNALVPQRWVKFFEHFAGYERLYRVLLSGKGSPWFADHIRAYLAEVRSERKQEHCSTPNGKQGMGNQAIISEYVPALVDALLIDTIVWWLEQGRPVPPSRSPLPAGA